MQPQFNNKRSQNKKIKKSLGDKKKFVTLRSQNKAGATKQKNKIQKKFWQNKKMINFAAPKQGTRNKRTK